MSGGKRKRGSASKKQKPTKRSSPGEGGSNFTTWSNLVAPLERRVDLAHPRPPASKAPVIELVSYEISYDPVEDDYTEWGLSREDYDHITEVSARLHAGSPATMVAELEALTKKHPRCPKVWNHLCVAYQHSGRTADARRLIAETYRKFPDYLFGVVNYCQLRLHEGFVDEIPGILKHDFALHHWLRGRKVYHISEVTTFFCLLAMYYAEIEEPKTAASYLDALEELNPDHPLTQTARSRLLKLLKEIMANR
jgi:tetratricopeptide (TPR) repeat protein